jgi:Cys-tRNA(Pro) deacylase
MDLENFLLSNNIWHNYVEKQETIHTADAALSASIDLQRVTKSLVLLDQDKNCILAIIPGNSKLSFQKVKDTIKVKKVRLVPFEDAEQYSGYLPGATPMVFHKAPMRVIMDTKLVQFESIYGGGGARTKLLELKTEDVIKINSAIVGDITE